MENDLIQKNLIYPGHGKGDYNEGTKVKFHLKTETCEEEPQVIDDSRSWNQSVELIFGKKFKLEVWEACIKTMLPGEVASFSVDKSLVSSYPIVAKTLREAFNKKEGIKQEKKPHMCCGMGFKEGLGFHDLDELVTNPKNLKFTIDLKSVENAGSYEKEFWAMNEEERVESIPVLRVKGNELYKEGRHEEASKIYSEALGRLEQLMLREKPGDEEWNELNTMKVPLLLNYSQCELLQGEFYPVIECCSTVLDKEPENVKALYRRGKAYMEVFSPKEARTDLENAMKLDPSLEVGCKKLLLRLNQMERDKTAKDKNTYSKLFS